jgi:hypothetical protein
LKALLVAGKTIIPESIRRNVGNDFAEVGANGGELSTPACRQLFIYSKRNAAVRLRRNNKMSQTLAQLRAEHEMEVENARQQSCFLEFFKRRPDLNNEANVQLIREDVASAFSTMTVATIKESVEHLEAEGRLAIKSDGRVQRDALAAKKAEETRLRALSPSELRTEIRASRTVEPKEKIIVNGIELTTKKQILDLPADDLRRLMNRGATFLDRVNEILAGGK